MTGEPYIERAWTALLAGNGKLAGELVEQATREAPTAETYFSVGLMHAARSDFAQAERALTRSVQLDPKNAEALYHLSMASVHLKKAPQAMHLAAEAVRLKPGIKRLIAYLFFTAQHAGEFSRSMAALEQMVPFILDEHPIEALLARKPLWDGQPGRRLLVTHVDGFGDNIEFSRYIPRAQAIADVSIFSKLELHALFERTFGNSVTISTVNPDSFDAWCPIVLLPSRLGVSAPGDAAPYLKPSTEKIRSWAPRLPGSGLKVGIISKASGRGASRDIDPTALQACAIPGVSLFNLTLGLQPAGSWMTDVAPAIETFDDTAAIMAQLDLVISVDTSTAHLAGALGKPVWVLLAFHPGWTWRFDGDTTPWYPTARLFRQPKPGDWATVVSRVRAALDELRVGAAAAVS